MNLNPQIVIDIRKINEIDSKFHRDLLALLYTPSVFTSFFPEELHFKLEKHQQFEILWQWFKSVELIQYPANMEQLRLGKYAEELMQFYFQNNLDYSSKGFNIQLIDEKLTVGEIDFLLHDSSSNELIHLEMAIKFFLKVKVDDKTQWIGPSTKDNLSKKQNKLINHQLKLTTSFDYLLPEQYQNKKYTPKLFLKGAEFIHYKEYKIGGNPMQNAWWVHKEELNRFIQSDFLYQFIPNRKDWIFPFNKRLDRLDPSQVLEQLDDYLLLQNEILIARFTKEHTPVDRGFVVRSNWPN